MIEDAQMPSFDIRLNGLKEAISSSTNLKDLAVKPNVIVSVDLLVVLMSDKDAKIRNAAMEIYLRRVYRAHVIKSLEISESGGVMTATWSFTIRDAQENVAPLRYGYMTIVPDKQAQSFEQFLPNVMASAAAALPKGSYSEPLNVLHIGITRASQTDDSFSATASAAMKPYQAQFAKLDIRTVNFFLVDPGKKVSYFNFLLETGFNEDRISRNMRPTMPQLLELNRMSENFELTRIPAAGRNTYMFIGKEKANIASAAKKGEQQQVVFLRSISLSDFAISPEGSGKMLSTALEELETAILDPRVVDTASSRIYLNILPDANLPFEETVNTFKKIMDRLISKYATRLLKLRVDEIEVKLRIIDPTRGPIPVRLMASSAMGGWLTREAYREYLDPVTGQATRFCPAFQDDSACILDPYPTSTLLQVKRAAARRVGSTYANDFLGLMEVALLNTWTQYIDSLGKAAHISAAPTNLFTFDELVLNKENTLKREKRVPGSNKIGMLAWHIEMKTPHYPEGREAVIIANDVTVQSGSFGVLEDEFFYKASEYARERGLPRLFISCNSGARIGLVDELKPKFKVAWKDERNPSLGFEYLYLTEEDYLALPPGTVDATAVTAFGPTGRETRYSLDAIIGQKNGIGVENLRGSGLIAGETSRAYDSTFTLSYVTGRSVGIGAYLNRLGQRVIQMQNGPMILTGYSALNKLLGKEVYTSQDQLGGPQIMHPNGVTHEVVRNDQDGVQAMMDWLEYIPKDFHSVTPVLPMAHLIDPPTRPVDFVPSKTPYDPRHMLAGVTNTDGTYLSGFFDKGTFKEYLSGWGKSVVAGRAKLGGVPVGVIAVETRLVEQRIPADPGNPDSRESILPQAGQVWYPDSAYKTAQVIQDFNRGENLPLIIFANWRGFSGGTRDMYGEILKFGAMIVDSLRTYKHPVFVYIPPGGELRGGAWVVIDPTINPEKMEMYADKQSRGGILEPPGICEVKYRDQEQKSTMHRLDPVLIELEEAMGSVVGDSSEKAKELQQEIVNREKLLSPLYLQVAHEFADLHDRAGRMKAKGCITEVLEWKTSRLYFYWRIRRRQAEDTLKDRIVDASGGVLTVAQAADKV